MNITSLFLKKSVFVNLLAVSVIIAGIFTALNMQREVFPKIDMDYVIVTVNYPGASPHEVERLITFALEKEIDTVDGIDKYTSTSRESNATIFIELELRQKTAVRNRVINDIKSAVDKADIPDDAENPETRELVFDEPLIEISFSSDKIDEFILRDYVNGFENQLKTIDGVGSVQLRGWKNEEIWIEADPNKLSSYEISLAQIIAAVAGKNINMPGGKFAEGNKEILIRTVGEIDTVDEFKKVIVRSSYEGKKIKINEVAKVSRILDDNDRVYKTDGRVAISLIPMKKNGADTIRTVDQIKKITTNFQKEHPELYLNILNDMSFYVKRRLTALTSNGLMGLVLLLAVLLIFLNFRIALVTAAGIPFAFMMALLMMSFFNISLNMITMFGLIIVLGMIVDDAIVVSENVFRHMEEGLPPEEATIKGVQEVFRPVLATIMTTIAAFAPLMFVYGIIGKFLVFFPIGVIFCLVASLFEAFIILPTHLAEWVKPIKSKHERKKIGNHHFYHKYIETNYEKLITFSLKFRYLLLVVAFLVLVATIGFAVKFLPFDLFPDTVEVIYVQMDAEEGTSIEGTNRIMSELEKIVIQLPITELKNITTELGFNGDPSGGPTNKYGSRYAISIIYLTPETSRARGADTIINELRTKIKEKNMPGLLRMDFQKAKDGPPVGKPIEIAVSGNNLNTLQEITQKIIKKITNITGVIDIGSDFLKGKDEIRIEVNEEKAMRLGLTTLQVAQNIRYAFEGGLATTLRKGTEEIKILIKLDEHKRNKINALNNILIPNNQNRLIKLSQVANFTRTSGLQSIKHENGTRTIKVTTNVNPSKIKTTGANLKIKPIITKILKAYPGYSYKLAGEWEVTEKSVKSLGKALLISLLLIYFILAVQFDSFFKPFIIMLSIPYGFIGVVFALYFHGEVLSLMALFGVIGLTGVIVNDSLILVEFINSHLSSGEHLTASIIEGCKTRLRPILLTSLTTIIALIPLIYGIGGEEPFVATACIAMAYGLLAATFVTLIIVPCCFLIFLDIKTKIFKREINS
ncbi:MAG: efflux RND transporter permease subunit [bacterium]|nr:efflux RND transporter permease subunit [bacterium]